MKKEVRTEFIQALYVFAVSYMFSIGLYWIGEHLFNRTIFLQDKLFTLFSVAVFIFSLRYKPKSSVTKAVSWMLGASIFSIVITFITNQSSYFYYVYFYRLHIIGLIAVLIPIVSMVEIGALKRSLIWMTAAFLLMFKVLADFSMEWLLAQPNLFSDAQTVVLLDLENFACSSLVGLVGIGFSIGAIYSLWVRKPVDQPNRDTKLILLGTIFYFLLQLLRALFVFQGYQETNLHYLLETFSILPLAMYLAAFNVGNSTDPRTDRYLYIWMEVVLIIVVSIASVLYIRGNNAILSTLFVLSMFSIVQSIMLFAVLLHLIHRDRVNTGSELINATNRLTATIQSIHDAVIYTRANGEIVEVNHQAEMISGFYRSELVGMNINGILSEVFEEFGTDGSETKVRCVLGNQTNKPLVEVRQNQIKYKNLELTIYALQDLTQLRKETEKKEKLEKQLLRTQKMEIASTLIGGIIHDFNNFVTGLMANVHLIKLKIHPDDQVQENINNILDLADSMSTLVQKLKATSRSDRPTVSIVNANECIKQVIQMIRYSAPQNIIIKTKLNSTLPLILMDSVELVRCLMNICLNAIHAMGEKGILFLASEMKTLADLPLIDKQKLAFNSDDVIHISISDTGCGIPTELKDKIFDPYFTTRESEGGTGLGLSVAYNVVKLFNGVIDFDSENGKGTTFHLYFPTFNEDKLNEFNNDKSIQNKFDSCVIAIEEEHVEQMLKQILKAIHLPFLLARPEMILQNINLKKRNLLLIDLKNLLRLGKPLQKLAEENPLLKIIVMGFKPRESEFQHRNVVYFQEGLSVPCLIQLLQKIIQDMEPSIEDPSKKNSKLFTDNFN